MMNLNEEALQIHKEHNGKLATVPKAKLEDAHDLSVLYTPGVAEPCRKIREDKDLSFEYTCRGNMVAVVSDGTRVLGLGNIGPEAGMPVMEGKSVLYKVFADIDSVPICLDTTDKEKFVEAVRYLQPSFAGINLEDIESPKCFDVEDELIEKMDIPVFHDDQHGTAIACAAALSNALRFVKKDLRTARIVINGVGAAGSAIVRLLLSLGAENIVMVDAMGIMYDGMETTALNRNQLDLIKRTNKDKIRGNLFDAAQGADVLPVVVRIVVRIVIHVSQIGKAPVPERSEPAAGNFPGDFPEIVLPQVIDQFSRSVLQDPVKEIAGAQDVSRDRYGDYFPAPEPGPGRFRPDSGKHSREQGQQQDRSDSFFHMIQPPFDDGAIVSGRDQDP